MIEGRRRTERGQRGCVKVLLFGGSLTSVLEKTCDDDAGQRACGCLGDVGWGGSLGRGGACGQRETSEE